MLQILVLALVLVLVLKMLAPIPAFLRGFGSLLENPERGRAGVRAWFSGGRYVGGEAEARPVVMVAYPRRGRRLGYLTLALATTAEQSWNGSDATEGTEVSTAPMREALDALIGRHGLSLELQGGWLRATWTPVGLFIFPGRFDAEKWRDVLVHMQMLARELEQTDRKRAKRRRRKQPAPTATARAAAPPLGSQL